MVNEPAQKRGSFGSSDFSSGGKLNPGFDPSSSSREMRKIMYYENMFSKMDSQDKLRKAPGINQSLSQSDISFKDDASESDASTKGNQAKHMKGPSMVRKGSNQKIQVDNHMQKQMVVKLDTIPIKINRDSLETDAEKLPSNDKHSQSNSTEKGSALFYSISDSSKDARGDTGEAVMQKQASGDSSSNSSNIASGESYHMEGTGCATSGSDELSSSTSHWPVPTLPIKFSKADKRGYSRMDGDEGHVNGKNSKSLNSHGSTNAKGSRPSSAAMSKEASKHKGTTAEFRAGIPAKERRGSTERPRNRKSTTGTRRSVARDAIDTTREVYPQHNVEGKEGNVNSVEDCSKSVGAAQDHVADGHQGLPVAAMEQTSARKYQKKKTKQKKTKGHRTKSAGSSGNKKATESEFKVPDGLPDNGHNAKPMPPSTRGTKAKGRPGRKRKKDIKITQESPGKARASSRSTRTSARVSARGSTSSRRYASDSNSSKSNHIAPSGPVASEGAEGGNKKSQGITRTITAREAVKILSLYRQHNCEIDKLRKLILMGDLSGFATAVLEEKMDKPEKKFCILDPRIMVAQPDDQKHVVLPTITPPENPIELSLKHRLISRLMDKSKETQTS